MTNADMFRAVFNGLMATELWAKPESEFLEWLNAEAIPNETFRQWMLLPEPPPERKTAHWVFGNTMGHSWMKCSECCVSQSGQTGCWSYCPNCGAEMKGETEVEID